MVGNRSIKASWGAAALFLVLALAPAAARAAGPDNFAQAPVLHFGPSKADQTNLFSYSTEPGEMLTLGNAGSCGQHGVKSDRTVWYLVPGNGRTISVGASGPVQTIVAVYKAHPFGSDFLGRLVDCQYAPNRSAVAWNSAAGQNYWVQVGLCYFPETPTTPSAWCSGPWPSGTVPTVLVAGVSGPPSYDNRGSAADLQSGVHYDNHGATRDEAESNSCGGTQYGTTVWLKWTAPTWGTAVFNLGGLPGVVSIRRAGSDAVADCGVGAARARVSRGETLYIQVGGSSLGALGYDEGHFTIEPSIPDPDDDNDGHVNATDCQPLNGAVHPGRPEIKDDGIDQNCVATDDINLDRDGDGSNRPADCDDGDPNRFPGNVELRGNGHDENCIARDNNARKPPTAGAFKIDGGRLTTFALNHAVKGSRIVVTCRGPSCRRSKKVVTKRLARNKKRLKLPRSIVGTLQAGTMLRVQVVNRPAWIGRRFEWYLLSAEAFTYKGYCQRSKKWRRC